MIFFGVLVGLGLIGFMIYLALDRKSNFPTRMASLGALAVMILSIIVCLIIIFTDNSVPVDESILIVGAPVETAEKKGNIAELLLMIIFLLILLALIVFLTFREHKKNIKNQTSDQDVKSFGF